MTSHVPSSTARARAARLPLVVWIMLAGALTSGCAGWAPWKNNEKTARNAELYGPTANQRIKTLEEEAKTAKAASQERQIEFTQDLARKVLEEHDARVRAEIVAVAAGFDTASAIAV